jgi:Holliday junction resolvase RusA-like endonuclease
MILNPPEKLIAFSCPLVVPTANHYKAPIRYTGRDGYSHLGFKLTAETKAFRQAVCIFAQGRTVVPVDAAGRRKARYNVTVTVTLGRGQRMDEDNCLKVALDALQYAGVIDNDSKVHPVPFIIRNNRDNPGTAFVIERVEEEKQSAP